MSIKISGLCFSYGSHTVLENVSFSAEYGEFLSVLGPNGAGKSTLFKCILGLLPADAGTVFIEGKDIKSMTASELSRKIAYIPQSHNPIFNYSVLDMVLMGTTSSVGTFSSPGREQLAAAENALEALEINKLSDKNYSELSGGERQLVLIARALAQQAKILIMDEPSSSLDFGNRVLVMKTVKRLVSIGYSVIQSTHDPEQAYMYSDKILALQNGTVSAFGIPQEVITEGLVKNLYGIDSKLYSLENDTARIILPVK